MDYEKESVEQCVEQFAETSLVQSMDQSIDQPVASSVEEEAIVEECIGAGYIDQPAQPFLEPYMEPGIEPSVSQFVEQTMEQCKQQGATAGNDAALCMPDFSKLKKSTLRRFLQHKNIKDVQKMSRRQMLALANELFMKIEVNEHQVVSTFLQKVNATSNQKYQQSGDDQEYYDSIPSTSKASLKQLERKNQEIGRENEALDLSMKSNFTQLDHNYYKNSSEEKVSDEVATTSKSSSYGSKKKHRGGRKKYTEAIASTSTSVSHMQDHDYHKSFVQKQATETGASTSKSSCIELHQQRQETSGETSKSKGKSKTNQKQEKSGVETIDLT